MISRPHDALFRRTFGNVEHASGLLRSALPESIVAAVEWDTLRREPGSFVDPKLADRLTDLLFSARLSGAQALIYVLAEHQSSNDRDMPLRMLGYLVRIWDAFRRDHATEPLPVILPLVVAHPHGGWSAPRSMTEMFDPKVLSIEGVLPYVPRLELLVDDLATLSDDTLRARAMDAVARVTLAMLRDNRDPQRLLANLAVWRDAIRALVSTREGQDMLRSLLIYISTVSDLHVEQIRATISEQVPEATPTVMTTAKQLIQEGLEQGLEQGFKAGRKEGQAAMLLRMLQMKFGPLDEAQTLRVRGASGQQLDAIAQRILTEQRLHDVLGEA